MEKLSREKGRTEEYELYSLVERLGPEIIAGERKMYKAYPPMWTFIPVLSTTCWICPWSSIPPSLPCPGAGWSAHRIEELINMGKIIRPAYKYVGTHADYAPLAER